MADIRIAYVKQKGTCVKCKKEAKKDTSVDPLIKKGDLYWERETGQFPIKFHFDCYAPKNHKWAAEKISAEFEEQVGFLKPKDQVKVWSIFEGQEERIKAIVVPEHDEPEAAEPAKKKKKESRPVAEIVADANGAGWAKLNMDDLKEALRSKGLKVSGKKEELVERCEAAFKE